VAQGIYILESGDADGFPNRNYDAFAQGVLLGAQGGVSPNTPNGGCTVMSMMWMVIEKKQPIQVIEWKECK